MEENSAQRKADELRVSAAASRDEADRLEREAAHWAQGAEGERLTAAALEGLGRDAVVLHDRLLEPGISKVNLDHVVVSAAGVFLVDTKNWSGDVSVYDGNLWQHTQNAANRKHHPKHQELDTASRAAAAMERVLSGPVVPALALAASRQTGFHPERVRGVQVLPLPALVPWLRAQPAWLTPAQVEATAHRVDVAFPPAGTVVTVPAATSRRHSSSATPSPHPSARQGTQPPAARSRRSRQRTMRRNAQARPGATLLKLAFAAAVIVLVVTQLPRIAPLLTSLIATPHPAAPSSKPSGAGAPAGHSAYTAQSALTLTLLDGSPAPGGPPREATPSCRSDGQPQCGWGTLRR